MTKTRIHPETGKLLRRGVRAQCIAYGSLSETIDVPGWYPDDESDAVHSGADLEEANERFKALRGAYAGRVRAVRKQLGLTQVEAGAIIGGGPRAFQKYESGKTPPSEAAVGLIELLARHPEDLGLLRSIRTRKPSSLAPAMLAGRAPMPRVGPGRGRRRAKV